MFDLQGHRGARGLFPENTIEGFRAASALGVRCFELDVGVTRDGVPVVHHDPALNPNIARGPDGVWLLRRGPLLRDLTFAELQRFDVGRLRPDSFYAANYFTQRPSDGARIPSLRQVLDMDAATRFNIELKLLPQHPGWTVPPEEMVERVLDVVDTVSAEARVTIQSFDWRAPRHVRHLRPGIPRGWLTSAETVRDAPLWLGRPALAANAVPDAVAEEGGGTWTPFYAGLTKEQVDRSHALGLKVIPWTVNRPSDMRRLIGWGVDGLITDWPDRTLAVLDRYPPP